MLESVIEHALVRQCKAKGGWALKFTSPGTAGVPDRLVLFKDRHMGFVELKAPGKTLRPIQERRKKQLEALGYDVFVVDSLDQVPGVIKKITGGDE